jgi:hypothetical protein
MVEDVLFLPESIAIARKDMICRSLDIISDLIKIIVEYDHTILKIGDYIVCIDRWMDYQLDRPLRARIINVNEFLGDYQARVHYFRCGNSDQTHCFYPCNSRFSILDTTKLWTGAKGPDFVGQLACECNLCTTMSLYMND